MSDELAQNPKLACHAEQIQKNRDFTGGQRPVKAAGTTYMPKPDKSMSQTEYDDFLKRVVLFPGASRALDGFVNLVLLEDPVLNSPTLAPIKNRITRKGDSIEAFAEEVISEALVTDYLGLLVDHPTDDRKPANLNKANAIQLGWHPFLASYPFESILDFDYGYVPALGEQFFTYVQLRDSELQYRILELIDGVYTVKIRKRDDLNSQFYDAGTFTPMRDGKTIDFIPFDILKRHTDWYPKKALMEDVVNLNAGHYIQEGDLQLALFHCAGPQKVVINARKKDKDDNYVSNEYPAGSWNVLEIDGTDTDMKYFEFAGTGVVRIEAKQAETKSQMAAASSRILADDKAVAENAETIKVRQASENATLKGVTRTIMVKLEKVLRWQAWWMGAERKDDPETRFTLNLDFTPSKMTAAELLAFGQAKMLGDLTEKDLFYLKRAGGIHPDTLTYEAWKAERDQEAIDKPVVRLDPNTGAL